MLDRMSDASLPEGRPDDHRHRRRAILETAARLICEKGYEGTSIQDIAAACQLTKAGLYHHIRSKEHLLLEIMNYGMDLFEDQVVTPVLPILDPLERLYSCMERNLMLVTEERSKEITIILHEHNTLTGEARVHIDARKKRYVRLLEASFAEAMRHGTIRPVNPTVAAFSFLGSVLWTYKWFRQGGAISREELVREMKHVFFGGLTVAPPAAKAREKAKRRQPARPKARRRR
jgi:TetR/AcrR family transcriptional regulator, cholesterol catabolism regulator